mmetsp:Transcript_37512/g.63155  ORF Transcript_37512/g.63155 Transcript_37512/m.63155 type:complete len:275 (+) Transcript_37512:106-930(+)|eukprot:CAMPEP_0198208108 /NCGR_PEP_ID=MMETSP1445-20131203/11502_1 /TAXON_ID=36898 /ORGANISM="Pyramimonas sp., Strain CCMP2087" /LENGTH=274 /DNA_ID=CAMNT_0043881379 /DNA_START=104 /DNA_END=928 /DNA_ORIENTATION=+
MFSSNACHAVLFLVALSLGGVSARTLLTERTLLTAKTPPVNLLSAEGYVILAKTGISTVPTSIITGDIAVSPIAGEALTGFSLTLDSSGQFAQSDQVTGRVTAANYAPSTPVLLTSAVSAMEAAYTDAAGRTNADDARINMNGGTLGGDFGGATAQLTPGIYTFQSSVSIAANIHFLGSGVNPGEGDEDVFIIQLTGDLLQAANTEVILENGALAKNIFWQVAGFAHMDAGAKMKGIMLVKTDVLFKTGSSLNGRVLSQTACDLQMATITQPTI